MSYVVDISYGVMLAIRNPVMVVKISQDSATIHCSSSTAWLITGILHPLLLKLRSSHDRCVVMIITSYAPLDDDWVENGHYLCMCTYAFASMCIWIHILCEHMCVHMNLYTCELVHSASFTVLAILSLCYKVKHSAYFLRLLMAVSCPKYARLPLN